MKLECCTDLEFALARGYIHKNRVDRHTNTYYIEIVDRVVNDGDGYFDVMTDELELKYCPFCGKEFNS